MKIGVFGFGCVRQFGSVQNRQQFPISLDACVVVNLCSQSTERIYHGKFYGAENTFWLCKTKLLLKRFMESEDFFAEFETSLIPGEEERGREEMRVGMGGGLEERTGEMINMDNLFN